MDALTIKPPFVASPMQAAFFDVVEANRRSVFLEAVAGSGKSTSIVRALVRVPEHEPVAVLAFNKAIADEMKEKVAELRGETGRDFRNVRVSTFHSLGYGALCRFLRCSPAQLKTDARKVERLAEQLMTEEEMEAYGSFCADLVSLAKGEGIGKLCPDDYGTWFKLVEHHDLQLASQDAELDVAIEWARRLLKRSNEVARDKKLIDYDDMLFLVVLWRCQLFPQSRIFVDEAQDTNPVRRAIVRAALRVGGKVYAVGDRGQAIYGFTGASHDAVDLIVQDFSCVEMPLTVSYRCPRAVEAIARQYVPAFTVHEDAPMGSLERGVELDAALARLTDRDAILCRNVAPLVSLAYAIMAKGRGCRVLGREIGAGLTKLVKSMRATRLDDEVRADDGAIVGQGLRTKLRLFQEREVADAKAKGEERKAQSVEDRVACVEAMIDNLPEGRRTIPALIAAIETMFSDDARGVLTLSSEHKAKGREWDRVGVWMPSLSPSPWARQEHQYQQELNLMYVTATRCRLELLFMAEKPKKKETSK